MPGRPAVSKTHFLRNDDLRSIVEPADPNESTFTATKGNLRTYRALSAGPRKKQSRCCRTLPNLLLLPRPCSAYWLGWDCRALACPNHEHESWHNLQQLLRKLESDITCVKP